MRKKILVIGTGGTIASTDTKEGIAPTETGEQLLRKVPQIDELCDLTWKSLFSVDSTDMHPDHWTALAKYIHKEYETYDGFLILHGTDTMAYTAAALSYLLQNSTKPIVLTGSQKPMADADTDAVQNVRDAILYLLDETASDVNVVFAGKVIPGCRVRKTHAQSLEAFECVGYTNRALIKDGKVIVYLEKGQKEPFTYYDSLDSKVIDMKLVPGLPGETLRLIRDAFDGFVIEGFGLGGLPEYDKDDYFSHIQELLRAGKTVAITTQVPEEGTDMNVYQVGRRFADNLSILEGKTMTPEAMTVKLMWILGQTKDPEKIRELFYRSVNYDLI